MYIHTKDFHFHGQRRREHGGRMLGLDQIKHVIIIIIVIVIIIISSSSGSTYIKHINY